MEWWKSKLRDDRYERPRVSDGQSLKIPERPTWRTMDFVSRTGTLGRQVRPLECQIQEGTHSQQHARSAWLCRHWQWSILHPLGLPWPTPVPAFLHTHPPSPIGTVGCSSSICCWELLTKQKEKCAWGRLTAWGLEQREKQEKCEITPGPSKKKSQGAPH